VGWIQRSSRGGVVPAYVLTPTISTTTLPQGEVGAPYSATLSAFGGVQPYTWSLLSGPAWLSCSAGGVLSGTPTTVGTPSLQVQVQDVHSVSATATLSIGVIAGPVVTTTPPLPSATVGSFYSVQLTASGGTAPYTWGGSGIPGGLTLMVGGILSGTPTTSGTDILTVTATDSVASPSPPTNLQLVVSAATTTKKWHPGHYVLPVYSANHVPNNSAAIQAQWAAALAADARFVGVHGFYNWYQLEPVTQGTYDFSSIDNDLAYLQANFPTKKLIIEIWSRTFGGSSIPTTPQNPNSAGSKIPDYICNGNFTGSGGVSGVTWNSNGILAAFWVPAVLSRLKALDAALSARYDSNPMVEAICYDEYSPPGPAAGAPTLGWSNSAEQTAWKSFHAAMNWPATNIACMANFPRDANGACDFALFSYLEGLKIGVGGPDVLTGQGNAAESWGEQIVRGAGIVGGVNFGTTDYRGAIPIIYDDEDPIWTITPAQIEIYCYNTLQATHISWMYNPTNVDGLGTPGAGTQPWTTAGGNNPHGYAGVVDTLQANSFRIHSSVPTSYLPSFDFYISPTGNDGNAGTIVAPWAITSLQSSNSNNSKIAGKRIGLMVGTYNLGSMTGDGNYQNPLLNLPAGSSGSPTYISSTDSNGNYSARGAVLNMQSNSTANSCIGQNMGGNGLFTIDGVVLDGGGGGNPVYGGTFSGALVSYWPSGSAGMATFQNCEVRNLTCTGSGNNVAGIFSQGSRTSFTITNCYFHDIYKEAQADHCHGIEFYSTVGAVITASTFVNCDGGISFKGQGQGGAESGCTVSNNYFGSMQGSGWGTGVGLRGFDLTGPTIDANIVHHNIFNDVGTQDRKNDVGSTVSQPSIWYNNTIYDTEGSNFGVDLQTTSGNLITYYNNLIVAKAPTGSYRLQLSSGLVLLDYNAYFALNNSFGSMWRFSGTTYSSLATWQTATGGDSHGLTGSTTPFASTITANGAANLFQLAGGSSCINAGRVGGLSSGASVNIGAWDGTVTQIGKNF
jgi:hypothetical protein